jgi:hypothetical protein
LAGRNEGWLTRISILVVWFAAVAAMSIRQVPFRDEVRALSIAAGANSLPDLFQKLKFEGHPMLWYVLLGLAHHIVPTPGVVKAVSVAVAFGSVAIFLFRAPFPLWFRCFFLFCGLPFYEYSVMARNYGISMLLMFAFAACYSSRRNPVLLGFILFLLANTNAPSLILAGLLLGIPIWDYIACGRRVEARPRRIAVAAGAALAISGIVLCVLTGGRAGGDSTVYRVVPASRLVASTARSVVDSGGQFLAITGMDTGASGMVRLLEHGDSPNGVVQALSAGLSYLLLLFAIGGLLKRPILLLASLAALWGMATFFRAIYAGQYRQQGLWLVFVLTLYWLAEARQYPLRWPRLTAWLQRISWRLALPLLLLISFVIGAHKAVADWRLPYSSSRELGQLLHSSDDLRRAVVMAEPEWLIDAVPYYADNRLYLLRQSRYGDTARWTRFEKLRMSLGELLSTAHRVHTESGRPVVIVMYHSLDAPQSEIDDFEQFRFSFTEAEAAQFRAETRHLASFRRARSGENYDVYLLN